MSVMFQRLYVDRPSGEGEARAVRLTVPNGDEENVTLSGARGDFFHISGSADGRAIAQVRSEGGEASSLWIAPSDDPAATQRIARMDDGIRSVLWSHDRSAIFFTTIEMRGEEQVRERFWHVAATGGEPRLIATRAADGPYGQRDLQALTRDGNTIVWVGAAHEGAGGTERAGTLDTRTGKITTFDRPIRTICSNEVAVTADASTLVYVRADRELVVRSVSTQREHVLYHARRQALESVILSPDGQTAMVSDTDIPCHGPTGRRRITDVVAVGVNEIGDRRIHRARGDQRLDARSWSPDGKWIWLDSGTLGGPTALYDGDARRIRSFGNDDRETGRTFLAWLAI